MSLHTLPPFDGKILRVVSGKEVEQTMLEGYTALALIGHDTQWPHGLSTSQFLMARDAESVFAKLTAEHAEEKKKLEAEKRSLSEKLNLTKRAYEHLHAEIYQSHKLAPTKKYAAAVMEQYRKGLEALTKE